MNTASSLDEIISLTQNLIKIRTTEDNETALSEALLLIKKDLNQFPNKTFSAHGKQSILIHNGKPDTKHFKILLNGHLDVVPAKKAQFEPHIIDGKLYGRGAYDMKAAAAVMIKVFKAYAKDIAYPLALQLTTDEEKGSNGAQKQVEEGIRADFIITGECGNNFQITNRAKGVYHAKITVAGTVSHGAYPWLGDNAIMRLHRAIDLITHMYPIPKEESNKTTVNITRIRTTNTATNRTPDHAEAHLDIRYAPEDKTIFSDIAQLLPKGVTIEAEAHYSALDTPANNKYIHLLQKIGKEILKQEISLRNAHATSDVVRFAEVGCDGIEFGPNGANQHSDNEWVDIASLGDYHEILKQFLLSVK
jgi:succinyl-diaminopimelate desuccinylase